MKQCSLESPCKSNLKFGWSSHGAPLREIKKLEVKERGNPWFNDKSFTGREKAVWVCENPVVALRYLFSAELSNALEHDRVNPNYKPPAFLAEEFREFKAAISQPESYLEKVNLEGAVCVLEDGDGGYLFIKRKGVNKCSRVFNVTAK